jgi:hypothetical protein
MQRSNGARIQGGQPREVVTGLIAVLLVVRETRIQQRRRESLAAIVHDAGQGLLNRQLRRIGHGILA